MNPGNYHLITRGELNIVLDVPTGAVHVFDAPALAVFKALAEGKSFEDLARDWQFSPEELADSWQEVHGLIEQELLFTRDVKPRQRPGGGRFKAMCLHVAHDCDLRCRYCFASTGSFGGERGLMDADVARSAVDLLLSSCGHTCEIDFFGGEPLLNMEVVRRTAAYARERAEALNKKVNLTLTTNANALTPALQHELAELGLDLVLSHDGRPEVHDKMRPGCDGCGSYQAVTENIQALLAKIGDNHYVRGTYTALNTDFVRDIEHWLDLGFRRFSLEPVVAPARSHLAIRTEHLPQLRQQYWQLAELALNTPEPFVFFHFLIDWSQGPCGAKRASGCGAGVEYLAVSPAGELYPCHQFVGQSEWRLGDVYTGVSTPRVRDSFAAADMWQKETCRKCWARYYCGGGCHANAWWANQSLDEPWDLGCELLKMRMEAALFLKVKQALNEQTIGKR
ncbi:MAG: thioether cross-link-forming SCIFF peptide maturase [Firmicutes bacterium]|nr:thioether cross-link-forming SCIFF peptide maturase [Bacillota bacterium]